MNHDVNVIGAAILLISDRMQGAIEATTGQRGAHAAALTALHGWANEHPIDDLARGLGVSHSRTVRVVDGLCDAGLARRRTGSADRRQATVLLTARGTAAAERVLQARESVLDDVLSSLPPDIRAVLAHACESIILASNHDRDHGRLICRLCDVDACGHHDGRCPSTRAADA